MRPSIKQIIVEFGCCLTLNMVLVYYLKFQLYPIILVNVLYTISAMIQYSQGLKDGEYIFKQILKGRIL